MQPTLAHVCQTNSTAIFSKRKGVKTLSWTGESVRTTDRSGAARRGIRHGAAVVIQWSWSTRLPAGDPFESRTVFRGAVQEWELGVGKDYLINLFLNSTALPLKGPLLDPYFEKR